MSTVTQVRAPRTGGARTTPGNGRRRAARREAAFGYAMASLSLIAVFVFTAGPIVASFVLALFKWDVISSPEFVGRISPLSRDTRRSCRRRAARSVSRWRSRP